MARRSSRSFIQVTVGRKLPPLKRQLIDVQNEIRKDLDKVAKAHQKSFERVVRDWSTSTRPKFSVKVVSTAQRFGVNLRVKEANRKKPIWFWIDESGTKRHKIPKKPKRGRKRLRFRAKYSPKTNRNPARHGGSGRSSGPTVFAKQVNHPGFKPRKFSAAIMRDMRPAYNRAVRNGARRGVRRALRSVPA